MTIDRISVDPNICHGQACVRGTGIPVHRVVRMLANSDTAEGLLDAFPSFSRDDIQVCLAYATDLADEQITPVELI